MNPVRRAARVVADEGFAGLFRRVGRKLAAAKPAQAEIPAPVPEDDLPVRLEAARREYAHQAETFHALTRHPNVPGLDAYYWYHAVDLGGGVVTPGDYDFRDQLPAFGFPDDMTGLRVLDVGSATGYFAFEFERRGADVTSVELPSIAAWDAIAHERPTILAGLRAFSKADNDEEAYHRHLDGPFRFCQARLGARVRRVYSSVYDLRLDALGGEPFDLIYAGDVVLHLFSPLRAMDVLAGLCRGSILTTIETPFPGQTDLPMMWFRGNASRETDRRTWWALSPRCVKDVYLRLGFRSVRTIGTYSGIMRRAWLPYSREVIRADR